MSVSSPSKELWINGTCTAIPTSWDRPFKSDIAEIREKQTKKEFTPVIRWIWKAPIKTAKSF